ncbi:Tyrosine-protein kinase Btk29A [Acropora cervicornis]|uniref:Tyrosine-protein kinase Btk29A n=1 Tax=Acropora cervicornis TaxID=6130 RepID=A0AAD9PYV4_ACRCE|nr:Tyrosine-protein kinase Btk29A [Acropora cervicornis]
MPENVKLVISENVKLVIPEKMHGDHVRHYHIKEEDGQLYISDRHRYPTVSELINYHQHNSGGLVTRLRQPPSFGAAPVAAFGHDIWEIPRSEIVLGKELGAGQFGTVRQGTWRRSIAVAVKLMKEGAMSEDDFIDEAKVMTYVIDDEYTASEGTKFPIKWASPEVILYTKFSSKSDIWAFGILTWEIYSGGKQPYAAINNTEVVQKVLNGYRLEKPQRCPDDMYRMVTKCWQTEPEHRPNFASVKKSVSDFMGEDYDETFE